MAQDKYFGSKKDSNKDLNKDVNTYFKQRNNSLETPEKTYQGDIFETAE